MRRFVLALALALAGCAYLQMPPACGAPGPDSGEFRPVELHYLNDGDLDGRICVTLNGEGPFDAVIERASYVPNTGKFASAAAGGDRLEVRAWMAGSDAFYRETFAWSSQNYVVVVTQPDGSLRIDHFAQPPVFA